MTMETGKADEPTVADSVQQGQSPQKHHPESLEKGFQWYSGREFLTVGDRPDVPPSPSPSSPKDSARSDLLHFLEAPRHERLREIQSQNSAATPELAVLNGIMAAFRAVEDMRLDHSMNDMVFVGIMLDHLGVKEGQSKQLEDALRGFRNYTILAKRDRRSEWGDAAGAGT